MAATQPAAQTEAPAAPVMLHKIRSDELPRMAEILRQFEPFREDAALFEVDVILDANMVIRDLLWLSRKRRNQQARTEVMELLDCKIVRAHAPTFLATEIEAKIPKLGEQHRISAETLRGHWEQYRSRISFVDVGGPGRGRKTRDRKDTPYIKLQRKLEYPIATHDTDIAAMGGKILRIQVFGSLKSYSRNRAVEFHLKVAGIGSAIALFGLGTLMVGGLKAITAEVGRLPKPVIYLAIALLVVALLHPESRKRIAAVVDRLMFGTTSVLEVIFTAMQPLLTEHYSAKGQADASLSTAKTLFVEPQKVN